MVTALIAYWRGLAGVSAQWKEELKDPANVKKLLRYMQHEIGDNHIPSGLQPQNSSGEEPEEKLKTPFIWTGEYLLSNCLEKPRPEWGCPQGSLSDLQPGGSCPRWQDGLRKRQSGGSCDLPGGGSGEIGEPITYVPGTASPTYISGCGKLCTGFYCTPYQTGHPPDYFDPLDTAHPPSAGPNTTTPITTTSQTTSGSISATATNLPPYSGPECSTYTTSTVCNGSGGQVACVTQALCVPPAPCPLAYVASGTPVCTGENEFCLVTATIPRCNLAAPTNTVLPRGDIAQAGPRKPTSFQTVTVSSPTGKPEAVVDNEQHEVVREAESNATNQLWSINAPAVNLLSPRQSSCGESPDGCDYIRFCDTCVTAEGVPCLQADINAHTGALSGTDVSARVMEDGVVVCEASINCELWETSCSGITDYDCGEGNSMDWTWNKILYQSAKYGTMFPMFLERTVIDDIVFCCELPLSDVCHLELD